MLKRIVFLVMAGGLIAYAHGAPGNKPLRVLFVGNSYTFVNDLPTAIRNLMEAGGNAPFEAVEECPGGTTLKQHWQSGKDQTLLTGSHFDWMVLQDQSQEPSFGIGQLRTDMYPYVRQLQTAAIRVGTKPILFMTWGHKNGDPRNTPGDTYPAMQARLETGYETIARETNIPVAPVGVAWQNAVKALPTVELWQGDGSHPTVAGTYLAACVFYQVFYHKSPVGNPWHANLDANTAARLQDIAAQTMQTYRQP